MGIVALAMKNVVEVEVLRSEMGTFKVEILLMPACVAETTPAKSQGKLSKLSHEGDSLVSATVTEALASGDVPTMTKTSVMEGGVFG